MTEVEVTTQKQNKWSPWQRTIWQVGKRVGVSDIYFFFMEETEECFGFLIGPHISVAVVTSHVALSGKHVSISQFVHKSKTTSSECQYFAN